MLIEMASEIVATELRGVVGHRRPAAAHKHVMSTVPLIGRVVIVQVMSLELKTICVVRAPLPHVAEYVVQAFFVRPIKVDRLKRTNVIGFDLFYQSEIKSYLLISLLFNSNSFSQKVKGGLDRNL